MKKIKLSDGRETMVDDDDFEELNEFNWCPSGKSERAYPCRGTRKNGKQINVMMHRLLAGAKKGEQVDHIDGNTLNNQRNNLRVCSHAENLRNCKINTRNKSGFKGVSFIKARRKFAAHIKANYKSMYLGYFNDAKEAAAAYNRAAEKFFGPFAKLNII